MIQEYNGSTWQGKSYSKIVDTTQQVTSFPVVVRPMENTIPSWTIKGNMQQSGTPTSASPITPSECGDRTANLFDKNTVTVGKYINASGEEVTSTGEGEDALNHSAYIPITANTVYYFKKSKAVGAEGASNAFCWFDNSKQLISRDTFTAYQPDEIIEGMATSPNNAAYLIMNYRGTFLDTAMLNSGSSTKPYEPYGYKLDIKSGNTTTPVYLGQVQSTRKIKKLELTGNENNWTYEDTYERFGIGITDMYVYDTRLATIVCTHYPCIDDGRPIGEVPNNTIYAGKSTPPKLFIKTDSYTTINDFKTYLQQQYAAGTPVTIWYVLANETTGIVNEPIRKIGTYSDSVSGTNLSVTAQSPTTIDVDTSLKPSEMDLTYTGLKMCGRKKYIHGNSPQVMPSAVAETKELNGITITCDGKGTYTISGTASAYTPIAFNIPEFITPTSTGQGGNGTLSLFNTFANSSVTIYFYNNNTRVDDWVCTPAYRTNTVYSAIGNKTINKIILNISSGVSVQGTISPMFTNDGQLPVTYQPYLQWQ